MQRFCAIDLRRDSKKTEIMQEIGLKKGISRSELGAKVNLSKGSITKNINQMMRQGLVIECDYSSANNLLGRTPIGLMLKPDLFYAVGVYCRHGFVLLDASSECIRTETWDLALGAKTEQVIDYIREKIAVLLEGVDRSKIAVIGLTLPGILDPDRGVVWSSTIFPGSRNIELKQILEAEFQTHCFVINISHLRAVAEQHSGVAADLQNFIRIDSEGGAGIFINGQLYRGHSKQNGEFGWMQIQADGGFRVIDGRRGTIVGLL